MYSKLLFSILAASASVHASPIAPRQDFLFGLLQRLNEQGLTNLTNILAGYAITEQGQQLANQLSNGDYTFLAPSNDAFQPVLPGLQDNDASIGPILSYHLISGSYPADEIAPPRTHTVVPTLLTDGAYVNLGGNPQFQVLEQAPDGNGFLVRRTIGNGTVTDTTTYENLIIHVVDTVLTPPGDIKAALSSSLVGEAPNGFSQLGSSLQKVGQLENVNNVARTTLFAPIDDAFTAMNTTIAGLDNEQLSSILRNHIIYNNVLYSNELGNTDNANAASGAQLSFAVENDVFYVSYNNKRARVLRSDVTVSNGVIHVIDAVLA